MVLWSFVSKSSCNGNRMCNYSGTCCHAGGMGTRGQFLFPGQRGGMDGLLHDLGAGIATCCPFYTKAACASQQEWALSSAGRSEQRPGGQWIPLAEQSRLEYTTCLRLAGEPWASSTVSAAESPCLMASQVSAASTAVTMARYSRQRWLVLQGAWIKIAFSNWSVVWFLFKCLCNINYLQNTNNEWGIK